MKECRPAGGDVASARRVVSMCRGCAGGCAVAEPETCGNRNRRFVYAMEPMEPYAWPYPRTWPLGCLAGWLAGRERGRKDKGICTVGYAGRKPHPSAAAGSRFLNGRESRQAGRQAIQNPER